MNELCLFAGAGGGLLASKWLLGWRTVCYVEWDSYCQKILQARIKDGFLDDAPIWDDAQTFDGNPWNGSVDIITAGFPCQPFSIAGKREAEKDKRNMWPDTIRIIREVGPRFVLLENVPRLLRFDYFGTILGDLAEAGYDARWKIVSAAECGAPHLRKRLWIVAYSKSKHRRYKSKDIGDGTTRNGGSQFATGCSDTRNVPNTNKTRCTRFRKGSKRGKEKFSMLGVCSWWKIEPAVGRVAYGVADRVDRLRAIGNGQVPIVAATAWNQLIKDFEL